MVAILALIHSLSISDRQAIRAIVLATQARVCLAMQMVTDKRQPPPKWANNLSSRIFPTLIPPSRSKRWIRSKSCDLASIYHRKIIHYNRLHRSSQWEHLISWQLCRRMACPITIKLRTQGNLASTMTTTSRIWAVGRSTTCSRWCTHSLSFTNVSTHSMINKRRASPLTTVWTRCMIPSIIKVSISRIWIQISVRIKTLDKSRSLLSSGIEARSSQLKNRMKNGQDLKISSNLPRRKN